MMRFAYGIASDSTDKVEPAPLDVGRLAVTCCSTSSRREFRNDPTASTHGPIAVVVVRNNVVVAKCLGDPGERMETLRPTGARAT